MLNRFLKHICHWFNIRVPSLHADFKKHFSRYYVPRNLNIWYCFGILLVLVLVIQLISGIFLTMSYKPDSSLNSAGIPIAFDSVQSGIMREVTGGWLIRYMHTTGASLLFVVLYLHLFRGLLYGSYKKPRELVWIIGQILFMLLMAEAFTGYVLPWGQMSYWATQVVINLFDTIPVIGTDLANWIRGDYAVSGITLNRFFALHIIVIPLFIIMLTRLHIRALHDTGSNNPDGIEIKECLDGEGIPLDGIPFHPYYTTHDLMVCVIFLIVFCSIVFFAPDMSGYFLEPANFEPANPMQTPEHISPPWYFAPFYSILRTTPAFLGSQIWGMIALALSVLLVPLLPWLDRCRVKSIRYRSIVFKVMLLAFTLSFIGLGILGTKTPSPSRILTSQILTFVYFAFFISIPFYSKSEKTVKPPKRVSTPTFKDKLVFVAWVAIILALAILFIKLI